jgi:hypothetical protein
VIDPLNPILAAVVSVVVSAIASYLLGPRMALRQEAARGDAHVRTELRRILGEIALRLEHEVAYRESVIKGISEPVEYKSLKPWDLDEPFWRLIRTAEDPRLDRRRRERLYKQLRDIIPQRFEILRVLPQAPKGEDYSLTRPGNLLVEYLINRILRGKKEDGVDVLSDPLHDQKALDKLREIIERLREMEQLLEK